MVGERLAREAQRAHVERLADGVLQPAAVARARARSRGSARRGPSSPTSGRCAARATPRTRGGGSLEERPARAAVSRPRRPAAPWPGTRGRRARSPASACRSPAPGPRPRSPPARLMSHSWSSIVLVIACANVGPAASDAASSAPPAASTGSARRLKKPQRSASSAPIERPGEQQLGGAALADDRAAASRTRPCRSRRARRA